MQSHVVITMYLQKPGLDEDEESHEDENEIEVFPPQICEKFMLRLLEFRLKLQFNLADEGLGHKVCNVSVPYTPLPTHTHFKICENFILLLLEFWLKLKFHLAYNGLGAIL